MRKEIFACGQQQRRAICLLNYFFFFGRMKSAASVARRAAGVMASSWCAVRRPCVSWYFCRLQSFH